MSAWGDSHWVDYDATILNVFVGPGSAWIDYRYTIGHVGWRRILADSSADRTNLVAIAVEAKQSGSTVRVRATNGSGPNGTAEITAIQEV